MTHQQENDNEGRRKGLRNALSNDPFYRRIKDAMLVIMAFWAVSSNFVDWKSLFRKNEAIPTVKTEAQERIWARLQDSDKRMAAEEQNIAVIQATLNNIQTGMNDMRQDIRELVRQGCGK